MKSFRIYNNKTGVSQIPTFAGYCLVIIAVLVTILTSWFAPYFDFIGRTGNWICAVAGIASFTLGAFILSFFDIPAWKREEETKKESTELENEAN